MSKKKNYLIYLLFFCFLQGCSLDNKTGIWSGSEEEQKKIIEIEREQSQKLEVVKFYSTKDFYSEEIIAKKEIQLSKPRKITSWTTSSLNNQNSLGHIYLSGIDNRFFNKRIGKKKFSLSKILSQPLLIDNKIIHFDDSGTIYNFSINEKKIWKKNIYKKFYKKIYKNLSYAVHKNKIYVADNLGFIYALELNTGKLVWIKNHGTPIKSKLKIFNEKIFVVNQENRLLSFNVKDGTKVWDVRAISSFIKSQNPLSLAISKNGSILMITTYGDLIKVDSSNGSILWSLNVLGSLFESDTDFFQSSDIVLSGEDILLSTSSSIFSFNLIDGFLNWEKKIGSTNNPIIDKNKIFTITDEGYLIAINKNSADIYFSTNILKILKKKKRKTKITGFVLGSGKIYATTLNGYLIICSANSGKVERFKKIGDPILISPIISKDSLYLITKNNKIYGFR